MQEERVFSPDGITVSNISRISREQLLLEEERICELAELAECAAEASLLLFREGLGLFEVLSLISEELLLSDGEAVFGMEQNLERLRSFALSLSLADRAHFAELYLYRLAEKGITVTEKDFLPPYVGGEEFVYFRSGYADEAYDVFSEEFDDPRVFYADSIREGVQRVAEGKCDYCILPLEESGARLQAIGELLLRYDLKIDRVTPVFGFDGSVDMKYAIASRGFSVPEVNPDDDRYLEIRLQDDASSASSLLTAASILGSKLYRIGTAAFATEEGRKPYLSVVFRDEGREFTSLLVYLTMFSGGFTPVGIYKNLE